MRQFKENITENKTICVGLEDSKRNWKLCVRADGNIVHETTMPARYNILQSYLLKNYPGCKIRLLYEAGFRGFNLYDRLTDDGIECVVTPPSKVTQEKCSKYKNDRNDCRRLAKILEVNDYKACHVPDKERRQDRQVSRTLVCVQKDMNRIRNRIRKFLEYHGVDDNFKPGRWSNADYDKLRELILPETLQFNLNILLTQLDELRNHKKILTQKLKDLCNKPRYRKTFNIIKSAPGIGWFTAIRLVLEWGEDMSRFPSGKKFGSFTGLTNSEYSTGESTRFGRITGQSAYFVRAWLIQCAWVAVRRDPALQDKFERVWRNSGNKKKAIVAVARKLSERLRICVLKEEFYCLSLIK